MASFLFKTLALVALLAAVSPVSATGGSRRQHDRFHRGLHRFNHQKREDGGIGVSVIGFSSTTLTPDASSSTTSSYSSSSSSTDYPSIMTLDPAIYSATSSGESLQTFTSPTTAPVASPTESGGGIGVKVLGFGSPKALKTHSRHHKATRVAAAHSASSTEVATTSETATEAGIGAVFIGTTTVVAPTPSSSDAVAYTKTAYASQATTADASQATTAAAYAGYGAGY